MSFVFRAALLCGLLCSSEGRANSWRLTPAVEGGVDTFVQRFQITDDVVSDLVLGERALRDTTETFTELRGVGELALRYDDGKVRFLSRGRFSAGTDLLRESFLSELRIRDRESPHRFDGRVEVEGRQFREDSDFTLSSDAFQSNARLHYRRRFNDDVEIGIKTRGELLRYEDPSTFELDQHRGDLSATALVTRGFDLTLDLEAGGGGRVAPDSTEVSYARGFASADLLWNASLDWATHLHIDTERRDYRDDTVRSPYWSTVVEPSLTWRVDDRWSIRWAAANEVLLYDRPTSVYFDFWLGWLGMELRRSWGGVEASFESRWSWLRADSSIEDRYQQPSGILRLEWFPSARFWLSWSEELGLRDYVEPGEESLDLYSDYTFLRSTLLLSWTVRKGVRVDLFVSDEPENHRRSEDDDRLTLVTASLRLEY